MAGASESLRLTVVLALTGFGGLVSVIVYRLFFHPLSRIPGPKIAAVSRLYDFYYDCILGGKFVFKIEELHKQYGEPKARISVSEKPPEILTRLIALFRPNCTYRPK